MNCRNSKAYQNCEKRIFDGDGEYDSPIIKPIDMDIEGVPLIGFNYSTSPKTEDKSNKIVHFYIDDYQFERIWNNADKYVDILRQYKAVLSPDYSLYADFPKAVSIFNHYRNQWCGAYWQEHGINVIPTVGWIDESSYSYCFDGVPHDALICISTVGSFATKESRKKWLKGYHKALEILTPKKILFYGKLYDEIDIPSGIEYSVAVNQNTLNRKLARQRMNKER